MNPYQMLIGGEWVDATGKERFESENPFLGEAWALIPRGNAADVDRAVDAVSRAARELIDSLTTTAPPRDREVEAEKARARSALRFARPADGAA